jgi:Putative Ig domain
MQLGENMKRVTLFVVMLIAITATATKAFSQHRYNRSLVITTTSLPGGTVGVAYAGTVSASGGTKPYTFSATGLPGGLSINSATGTISGTPTQSSVGTSSVAITVRDSNTNSPRSTTANLQITIAASIGPSPLAITTTSLPGGTSGVAYTGAVAASGGTKPYIFSATGLPSGLSINSSTGAITGTSTTVGTASASANVTDSTTPTKQTATSSLSITINTATAGNACGNISTGNLGSLNGYVPFPASNAWNTNIAAAAVDSSSATIISALTGSGLHPDFSTPADGGYGIPYMVVDSNSTPGVSVTMNGYPDESDITLYPFPLNAPIEAAPGNCSTNGDNHVIVIDKTKCWIYETYATQVCNGTWSASNGAVWDMTTSERRPYGWTSVDAAGVAIFPGLVRYDEVAAGVINHAIRMTVNNTKSDLNGGYFVDPATHAAGTSSSTSNIMGMRLRLKASFNISGYSAANQVILKAMQQYGMIVADNGSNMYFQGTPDSRWNDNDLNNLKSVDASSFEVVQMGTKYDSGTAPSGAVPTISSFAASQSTVAAGTPVTLTWTVSGDSYDFIDVVGTVRGGSQTVTPTKTTTYILNSTNQFGRSTQQVTVTVQ